MKKYGRIKEGATCIIDMRGFNWPDFPTVYRVANFSKDMVFHIEQEGEQVICWTDGYGGSIRGRPGTYGNGSIALRHSDDFIEVDPKEIEQLKLDDTLPVAKPKWRLVHKDRDSYVFDYCVMTMDDSDLSITALRQLFPTGEANAENFVLFSTSGVHGTYDTIEDVEARMKEKGSAFNSLTFLVIQPRIVSMRYGRAYPETDDDFAFLKRLRETTLQAVAKIGQP